MNPTKLDFLDHMYNKKEGWEYILIAHLDLEIEDESVSYISIHECYPGLKWTSGPVYTEHTPDLFGSVLAELTDKFKAGLVYTERELFDYLKSKEETADQ